MEMISDIIVYIALFFLCWITGNFVVTRFRAGKHQTGGILRKLSDEDVRTELSSFLRKQMVVGDADIRQGIVYPPVPPERLDPLALQLSNAAATLARMQNPAADSLYFRSRDGAMHLVGIDLDTLLDAARVMQRVAEDRKKSRSLYKGMTEDELLALARASLSHFYKTKMVEPEWAADIMKGDWDDSREIAIIVSALDLTFKVKGASNG